MLAAPGNGGWYQRIENAAEIEQEQWQAFEDRFRKYHEQTLAYRFYPETDEEREIVANAFPEVTIAGKKETFVLTYDGIHLTGWDAPIRYAEITKCSYDSNNNTLQINYQRPTKTALKETHKQSIRTKQFGSNMQMLLDTFNQYYARYQHAAAYQEQKKLQILNHQRELAYCCG